MRRRAAVLSQHCFALVAAVATPLNPPEEKHGTSPSGSKYFALRLQRNRTILRCPRAYRVIENRNIKI